MRFARSLQDGPVTKRTEFVPASEPVVQALLMEDVQAAQTADLGSGIDIFQADNAAASDEAELALIFFFPGSLRDP